MMKAIAYPEGAELSHLVAACPLDGRSVLEVGCGPGTLTWQYAGLPRRVVALDPDASVLRQAFLLYKEHPAHARVWLWIRMKMVLYGKLGII
jgi:ubiquinone/menaquinone biosynthesis C-methylase UbiE